MASEFVDKCEQEVQVEVADLTLQVQSLFAIVHPEHQSNSRNLQLEEEVEPLVGEIERKLKSINIKTINPEEVFDGFFSHSTQNLVPSCN